MAEKAYYEQMEREAERLRQQLKEKEIALQQYKEMQKQEGVPPSDTSTKDTNVEELTKSFQRLQSDNDFRKTSNAQQQQIVSALLRKASTLACPGGKLHTSYKSLLKDLIIKNDPHIRVGLIKAEEENDTSYLEHYLKQVMANREKQHAKMHAESLLIREQLSMGVEPDVIRKKLMENSKDQEKTERKVHKEMEKAANVQKKLQRLGTVQGIGLTGHSPLIAPSGATASLDALGTAQLQQSLSQLGGASLLLGTPGGTSPLFKFSPPPLPQQQQAPQQQASPSAAIQTALLQQQLQALNSGAFGLSNGVLSSGLSTLGGSASTASSASAPGGAPGLNFHMPPPLPPQQQQQQQKHRQAYAMESMHFGNTATSGDLGSKRSRPESMQKFTSFRAQNRTKPTTTAAESSQGKQAAANMVSLQRAAGDEFKLQMQMLQQQITSATKEGTNSNLLASLYGQIPPQQSQMSAPAPSTGTTKTPTATPNSKVRPDIAVNTREYNKSKTPSRPRRWTAEEDEMLRVAVKRHQERNWKAIAEEVPGRNHVQCLQRWRKALDPAVVKGHWTPDEDARLLMLVAGNPKNWGYVAKDIPGRTAKQCRERYHNHLDPNIKKGDWTKEEDTIIVQQQAALGNKWAEISKLLPGRTENSVKIRWKSIQRYFGGNKQQTK